MSFQHFFQLCDDMDSGNRWHLSSPLDEQGAEIDPWQFKRGVRLDSPVTPLFRVTCPGRRLEFTLTGFTIPLLHSRVAPVIERLSLQQSVQLIPARVEGQSDPYYILNALQIIRCIDEARCRVVKKWGPEHGNPDIVDQYRDVRGLKIDPSKVGDAHIFRPWGWEGVLIISERVKSALEAAGVTGTDFIEV